MSDTLATNATQTLPEPSPPPKKKPFYLTLWGQVLIGVAAGDCVRLLQTGIRGQNEAARRWVYHA